MAVRCQPIGFESGPCQLRTCDRLVISECCTCQWAEVGELPRFYLGSRKPVLPKSFYGRLPHSIKPSGTLAETLRSGEWSEIGRSLCGLNFHDLHPRWPFMPRPPLGHRHSPWLQAPRPIPYHRI